MRYPSVRLQETTLQPYTAFLCALSAFAVCVFGLRGACQPGGDAGDDLLRYLRLAHQG